MLAQVKCTACQESMLVAFSCKGRGLCPSCGARRAEETAAHIGQPCAAATRQWSATRRGLLQLLGAGRIVA